jgi:endonuclease-3
MSTDALRIINRLEGEYPGAGLELANENPFQLLIGTILSAQSTDVMSNRITSRLFEKYSTPEDFVRTSIGELENDIRSSGYYRVKARYIKGTCEKIVQDFGSSVPSTMEDLLTLPGVGRKTANIVLTFAFGVVEGIAVDTHVFRLARRLGLSGHADQNKVEVDLMLSVPRESWTKLGDLLIFHGRRVCTAKKPGCDRCVLSDLCPSAFVT